MLSVSILFSYLVCQMQSLVDGASVDQPATGHGK